MFLAGEIKFDKGPVWCYNSSNLKLEEYKMRDFFDSYPGHMARDLALYNLYPMKHCTEHSNR